MPIILVRLEKKATPKHCLMVESLSPLKLSSNVGKISRSQTKPNLSFCWYSKNMFITYLHQISIGYEYPHKIVSLIPTCHVNPGLRNSNY